MQRVLNRLARPFRRYWNTDHHWEGRLVELLGNKVRIDGALVDVSDPLIPTKDKAPLLKRTYERPERLLLQALPTQYPVIELGASIGVLACIVNRQLADPTRHIVVEANPELIPILERNRTLNNARFQIENVALAYNASEITFYLADKLVASSLHQNTGRPITVPAKTLSQLVEASGFERFSLVCDIEGAELDMVKHDLEVLRARVPYLLLEQHPKIVGKEATNTMHQSLLSIGYKVEATQRHSVLYTPGR